MNDKYIGVFDSGVGGLTVVKHILEVLPNENIVFLADSKNVPYGDKTKEQIFSYSLNNMQILSQYDLKAVVIACNTSDSISSKMLKEKYDLPIYGVIYSAVKTATETTKNNTIAILATKATIATNEYEKQIKKMNKDINVISIATPEFVPLIEKGQFHIEDKETVDILKKYLEQIKDADTIILGCTHYDLLQQIILTIKPDINIVSSSRCVVDKLKEELYSNHDEAINKKEDIFITTQYSDRLDKISSMIIDNIHFKEI